MATRLLAALVLVMVTAAATAWLVASVVGPPLFHEHLERAGAAHDGEAVRHAEEAFRSATAVSLSVALLAGLLAALGVSAYVTRRVGRSVRAVATAAAEVAGGRYDTQVAPPGLGTEFDELAAAFNAMSGRLSTVETTRRRLLSDLAHEMRTPVATLDAYLEGLQDGVTRLDAETTSMLRSQTHRLTRLAEDISAVSRAEEHQLSLALGPLAPADLVRTAVNSAAAAYAAKRVHLKTEVIGQLPVIRADRDRLGQVLANLLDNALRHTSAGGTVTLTARRTGTGVGLSVTDTGSGIAAEHLPHVFERFYRVDTARDRDRGGSGIGLAITKALVEAHGGRVSVASAGIGAGSTFQVWLPAS
ncbi:sensor histidine kinase [Thalassiella azotivora]